MFLVVYGHLVNLAIFFLKTCIEFKSEDCLLCKCLHCSTLFQLVRCWLNYNNVKTGLYYSELFYSLINFSAISNGVVVLLCHFCSCNVCHIWKICPLTGWLRNYTGPKALRQIELLCRILMGRCQRLFSAKTFTSRSLSLSTQNQRKQISSFSIFKHSRCWKFSQIVNLKAGMWIIRIMN